MKKIVIIFLGVIISLVILIIINPPEITFEETKVVSPEKPNSVPDNTFWVGGIDGGNFIYIRKDTGNKKLFFVQIYNDYTGDIEFDGILKYSGNKVLQNSLNNPALYQGWDGETLHFTNGGFMKAYQEKILTKK